MPGTTATARRTLFLSGVAVGIGAVLVWWRQRSPIPTPTDPPEWPAWPAVAESPAPWATADTDGSVPEGYPIKAKESSGIFHEPGGRFYDRTNPDRCYATAVDAESDGYRRSKS